MQRMHYPQSKYTRVQYATYLLGLASELDVDYSEEELIHRIIEHFEEEVRHALLVRDVTNTEVLFRILADFDKERVVKQSSQRTATGASHSSAHQRSAHVNVRHVEVTKSQEEEKTPPKQKRKPKHREADQTDEGSDSDTWVTPENWS